MRATRALEHDPEKWIPVFGRRSCSTNKLERDHDSKKRHPALWVLPVLCSVAAFDVRPAASEIYRPWCAQYYSSSGNGATNCGFTSYEQCMMTATPGSGAFCVQNPWYLAYGSGQPGPGTAPARKRPMR
jgi:hypothetical protein